MIINDGGTNLRGNSQPTTGVIADATKLSQLSHVPIGIPFYGTEALAQKVADALPGHKVLDAIAQTQVMPSTAPAAAPPANPAAPPESVLNVLRRAAKTKPQFKP